MLEYISFHQSQLGVTSCVSRGVVAFTFTVQQRKSASSREENRIEVSMKYRYYEGTRKIHVSQNIYTHFIVHKLINIFLSAQF